MLVCVNIFRNYKEVFCRPATQKSRWNNCFISRVFRGARRQKDRLKWNMFAYASIISIPLKDFAPLPKLLLLMVDI